MSTEATAFGISDDLEQLAAFNIDSCRLMGFLYGGASKSVGSAILLEEAVEEASASSQQATL